MNTYIIMMVIIFILQIISSLMQPEAVGVITMLSGICLFLNCILHMLYELVEK